MSWKIGSLSLIKLTPIYKELLGDLDTPVSIYLKLNEPHSFLLESVTGGEQVARYSFIGCDPFCIFLSEGEENTVIQNQKKTVIHGNPITILESIVSQYELETIEDIPSLFGGAVGYFSWETIRFIEKIQSRNKEKKGFPLAHFLFPSSLIVFDHAKRKIIIAVFTQKGHEAQAQEKLKLLEDKLMQPTPSHYLELHHQKIEDPFSFVKSNYCKEEFLHHVEKVKQHIYEGDIFQLVLSQNFSGPLHQNPFDVYRKLRLINPSPYMFYFDFESYHIIGSSPEILSKLVNGKALVRPIAGTRPRVANDDEKIIAELQSDQKEKAEHIMLVDLGRNDLGRVCDFNTIQTTSLMDIEKYSHVIHMVSHVEGMLKPDCTAFDLFKATFPAGTVSGAPKIRAMDIIEELEPIERGPYAGALGYFDFHGNMDLCIIIRTILAKNRAFSIQAGAGIVADSIAENEFIETQNKARGMIEACL